MQNIGFYDLKIAPFEAYTSNSYIGTDLQWYNTTYDWLCNNGLGLYNPAQP